MLLVIAGLRTTAPALDPAKSLDQYVYTHWGADKGFLGGSIYAISQSSDGYLWLGTDRGLVRFDGFTFTLIQYPIAGMPAIGRVRGLLMDGEGNLWIRPEGLHLLLYRNGRFSDVYAMFKLQETVFTAMTRDQNGGVVFVGLGDQALRYAGGKLLPLASIADAQGTIISAAISRDGRAWLGTRDHGLYLLDKGRITNAAKSLQRAKINALAPDVTGGTWIGTDDGLRFLASSGDVTSVLPAWIKQHQVLAMTSDSEANLWVGTNKGLIRITKGGQAELRQSQQGGVGAVFVDRDGNLWFGGSQGLERLQDGVFTTYLHLHGHSGAQSGAIYVDPAGSAWIAPGEGGLYRMQNGNFSPLKIAGLDADIVYSIDGARNEIWIGRQRGGLTRILSSGGELTAQTFTQAQGLAQNSVYAVHRASDGSVWAGTVSSGLSHLAGGRFTTYTMNSGISSNAVNAIAEAPDGTLWVATPAGLDEFRNQHWRAWSLSDGLPSVDIRTCFADSQGVVWIATSAGLAYIANGVVHLPAGLPNPLREQLFAITEDRSGFLWFSTSDHVLRVNRSALLGASLHPADVQSYGASDGLIEIDAGKRGRAMVTDSDGKLWIVVGDGVAVTNPERVFHDAAPIGVRMESLTAGGSVFGLDAMPTLPAGTRSAMIHFSGDSLASPERVRYRYKLEGADEDWSDPVDMRQVLYNNLGPGLYRFHIVASRDGNLWNGPESTAEFTIARAYWQTLWFRLAAVLAALLVALLIVRIRMVHMARQLNARFEERLSERTLIAQDLHDTLLQSFQGLMLRFQAVDHLLPTQAAAAKEALNEALDRADTALDESRKVIHGIRDVPQSGHNLEYAMRAMIDALIDEFVHTGRAVPACRVTSTGTQRPVAYSPFAEIYRIMGEALRNAFLHAKATEVELSITFTSQRLLVHCLDNGSGIEPAILDNGARPGHWGLVGMKERASRIGAGLQVSSKRGEGTEVALSVPGKVAYMKLQKHMLLRWFRHEPEKEHESIS